jgi:hypothetical protein
MKKKAQILIAIYTLLLVASCNNSKGTTSQGWLLELKKGGCLDVCQSYTITIKQSGQFKYKGYYKVKHKGEKSGVLNSADIEQLKKLILSINWKKLEMTYGNNANGSQQKVLNYTSPSFQKKITYHRLEPQEMKNLERFIDTIIDHDEF